MKKNMLLLAAATVFFTACKKKENEVVINQWTANGTVHRATKISHVNIGYGIMAEDESIAGEPYSVTFAFTDAPKTGTYRVVSFPSATDEVAVFGIDGSYTNPLTSNASETRTVYVNSANGKATLFFQEGITLQPLIPLGGIAVELKGVVREN